MGEHAVPGDQPLDATLLPYLDTVYAVATLLTSDERSAENAVHETYRLAARSVADGPPVVDRLEWIVSVVRRVCAVPPSPYPSPACASPTTVREALAGLSAEQREVVVLRELLGLSYDALSRIIGVPVDTIASRLFDARALLLDTLDGLAEGSRDATR